MVNRNGRMRTQHSEQERQCQLSILPLVVDLDIDGKCNATDIETPQEQTCGTEIRRPALAHER